MQAALVKLLMASCNPCLDNAAIGTCQLMNSGVDALAGGLLVVLACILAKDFRQPEGTATSHAPHRRQLPNLSLTVIIVMCALYRH